MRYDVDRELAIRERIARADFANVDARRAFAAELRTDYTVCELLLFKSCADAGHGGDFGARTAEGNKQARLLWDAALEEAGVLIVKIRALRGTPTTFAGCAFEDAPDGLMDVSIVALRTRAVDAAQDAANIQAIGDRLIAHGMTLDIIDRNTRPQTPRRNDPEVLQADAARILTNAGYKVSKREIQNWEAYLKTYGKKGREPPSGYALALRDNLKTFSEWARNAASAKRMRAALRKRRQRAHKTN